MVPGSSSSPSGNNSLRKSLMGIVFGTVLGIGVTYCTTATLYYKPKTSLFKPDFYLFETDKWVVFPWEKIN